MTAQYDTNWSMTLGSNGPASEGVPEEHEADHGRGEAALHVAGDRAPGGWTPAKLTQSAVGESACSFQ